MSSIKFEIIFKPLGILIFSTFVCYGKLFAFSEFGINQTKDGLPENFPEITVTVNNNPSEGYIYLSNFVLEAGVSNTPYLMILQNDGTPVFYREMTSSLNLDFKPHSNGIYTYFDFQQGKYYGMNADFEIVDSFYCRNDFPTDEHELRILSNGNYLLLGNDIRYINMRDIVPRGNPNAKVIGFIIQEIDSIGNVLFHWSTFDHFQITDATEDIDLTKQVIDYAHCNALEIDYDGNILLSVRHFDEITKIDRTTGDIIWRMGGSKCENNEFTFTNDTDATGFFGFSHQHAIRLLPNGHYTLFDNGNLKDIKKSRAVEYVFDQTNKTVTKVWEFTHPDSVYTSAMGYVQRLSNGNTLIGWGENENGKTVTEVTPEGEIVLDLSFPDKVYSYRAFKDDMIPTPVEMETFTARIVDSKVQLNWQTATEVNNYGFEVQRRLANKVTDEFEQIGFIKGYGNSNSPKQYSFVDENPIYGYVQYRLKQIDLDGGYEYSKSIEIFVASPQNFELFQNYPNPFNPTTTIIYIIPSMVETQDFASLQNVTLKIYDALGHEVATLVNKEQAPGKYSVQFNANSAAGELPSGVYFYTLRAGNFTQTRKMLLLK